MIYTITFNPALDYVIHMDGLLPGQVNRTTGEEVYWGGKGINVSWILKELGYESKALGFLAGFTGKALEEGLLQKGIQTDFIYLEQGMTRINVKIKAREETDINGQGPFIGTDALEEMFEKLDGLKEGDILVLAGSIPSSLPEDIYEKILDRLSGRGISFVVDATKDLLLNVLKYHPFLIKPNQAELGEMFHTVLHTEEEIIDHGKRLQNMGARNVLVSMAGDGAILLTENGAVHKIGVAKGQVKNSVGAGDSMVAGFLAGYLKTKNYGYALQLGTAAGSATAFSDGLAAKEEIETLFQQIQEEG